MNFSKINILLAQKGITKTEFAKSIGITPAGLRNLMKSKGQPRKENLDKICKALNVPESYFYENELSQVNEPPGEYRNLYKSLLETKDKYISKLECENERLELELKKMQAEKK
jgi:transcriptional regulator with XRE-family HTH domain